MGKKEIAKRIRVTVEMDEHFLRMLKANNGLSMLRVKDELQPRDQLGLIVELEARGAFEEQVWQAVLPVWRPHIHMVGEAREVIEEEVRNAS